MDAIQALTFIGLGAIVGGLGQGARAAIGIKKELDSRQSQWFNGKELGVSFLLGAVAGAVAALVQYGPNVEITKEMLLGFAGAGYAGADFVAGLMQKWVPGSGAASGRPGLGKA